MKQPASLKKCLAILMSRAVGIDQKDTARSARCADATVASVEHWARDEECGVVAALCNDKDMKNMVVNEMCFWGLDAETMVKLDRVGRDDILRLYKGEEYLLEIQQATRKGQVHTVEKAVTLQPSQSGFTDPESLTGAKYLDIPIPSNDVWINSIETTTSHPTSPYKFLIFDRKQPHDFYNEEDVYWEGAFSVRRIQYVQPQQQNYHDADGCQHLHCAFEHEGHPRNFQLNKQKLEDHFKQPVRYSVKLSCKLAL